MPTYSTNSVIGRSRSKKPSWQQHSNVFFGRGILSKCFSSPSRKHRWTSWCAWPSKVPSEYSKCFFVGNFLIMALSEYIAEITYIDHAIIYLTQVDLNLTFTALPVQNPPNSLGPFNFQQVTCCDSLRFRAGFSFIVKHTAGKVPKNPKQSNNICAFGTSF